MHAFEFILILLASVMLSSLINRFIPALSAPVVQIILGVFIALIPFGAFGFEFEFETELFFVLFIAPLIFYSGMMFDRKTMAELIKPILASAFLLVFISVITLGYFLHFLIPAIPLTVAFVLVSALSPTDDVAVDAVAKRAAVPDKIMTILSGESVINDASGIVCFQFAMIAATTGVFSSTRATGQFLLVGLGGVFIGLAVIGLKYILVRWLRRIGIENSTLHILIVILTPFIIYMIAERIPVSGIVAVFSAGIAHSLAQDKFNPEVASLHIAQESVWNVLTFSLEGIVFILLGTQLPGILQTFGDDRHAIGGFQIMGGIFALTLAFAVTRFIWWVLTVRLKTYQTPDEPIRKIRAGAIFSLAGARGTVTLACVLSVPAVLSDGSAFPQRDLIILLASGVIVCSLLITNFLLPLATKRQTEATKVEADREVYGEIIRGVIARLISEATDETRGETAIIIRHYRERDIMPQARGAYRHKIKKAEKELREQIFLWEKENTQAMLKDGRADKAAARYFLERLEIITRARKHGYLKKVVRLLRRRRPDIAAHHNRERVEVASAAIRNGAAPDFNKPEYLERIKTIEENFAVIREANTRYVLNRLKSVKTAENSAVIERLISFYELSHELAAAIRQSRAQQPVDPVPHDSKEEESSLLEVARKGIRIERGLIQEMFESGRLTREAAKEMRANITAMEARIGGLSG
ncbi:MAG: Na+/H+ antiporter [Oscillospiraceae bacterium]|nr:Na+/H+ antiporter [Oscillospiraceae bacterium]